jgi:dUTP pyrophosphatase
MIKIPFTGGGQAPKRASEWAAGADLFAAVDLALAPGERALVPTGLYLAIPEGHAGLVWPRSGLAVRHGIDTMAGVIDSDYRGEVRVLLVNHGPESFTIRCGDRIAQLVIQRVERAEFLRAEELPPSGRGQGGFGSTGK